MSERYTVHLGTREEEWPAVVAGAPTRTDARHLAAAQLAVAPPGDYKSEVRRAGVELLDCFGRRGGTRVFHVYSAIKHPTLTAERGPVVRYHLTQTGFYAGRTLCGGPKLPDDRHAAWNGKLWDAPYSDLVADGCCPECAALWTDAATEEAHA